MLDTHARRFVEPIIARIARLLQGLGASPNGVSLAALGTGVAAAASVVSGSPRTGIALLWLSGLLDAVDGTLARQVGGSPLGAIFDITFDRVVEIALIAALAWRHPAARFELLLLAGAIAIAMSLFLAIAAALQNRSFKAFHYAPGLGERTEAFIFLSVMIADQHRLALWTGLFIGMILITMGQRLRHAARSG